MLDTRIPAAAALVLALALPPVHADAPAPGSVLFFPVQRSGTAFTLINVTNVDLASPGAPSAGVRALYRYVNTTPNPAKPLEPLQCNIFHRLEILTPGDTVSVLTTCHNPGPVQQGFLVVSAASATTGESTSHNFLVGSELVVDLQGAVYATLPYSFAAVPPKGSPTDLDADGRLDFDGAEYEPLPELLFADSFIGLDRTRLVLFHVGGDANDLVTVKLDIFNDNEFPLSLTFSFRCWFEVPLLSLSNVFSQDFLANTPNDPNELDVDCDALGDLETGWFRIDAVSASTELGTDPHPAILGALTSQPRMQEGGRLLFGSGANPTAEFP